MKPHVSVVTLIEKKSKILMIQRGDSPYDGKWSLPGGHLEFGEELEQAAMREVREETGMRIKIKKFLAYENEIVSEGRKRFHIVLFCFEGKTVGGRLKTGSDVKEAEWKNPRFMNPNEIPPSIQFFLKMKHII